MVSGAAAVAFAATIMAGCTADEGRVLLPTQPSLAFVGTVISSPASPEGEALKVCKEFANQTGGTASFTVTGTVNGLSVGTTAFDLTDGQCKLIWTLNTGESGTLTVTETAPATGFTTTIAGIQRTLGADTPFGPTTATSKTINIAGGGTGAVINFTNTPPPPPPICTFTKGWYRNNGENTITLTIDGRTPAQQRAIFDAKPGQPGGVTFGGDNTLLNLYQQLLAALNNLGGNATGGPNAVDVAIADALAGTGGTALNITTTLTQTQMSAIIDVLSAFNEGLLPGFPHCPD